MRTVLGMVRMRASALQQMTFSSDATESRDGSRGGATVQPSSSSRMQTDGSLEARSAASAGEAPIDLRAPVYELLRCVFRPAEEGGSAEGTAHDTHDAVRSVCAMARANDIRAETLILAIKAGWRQLPESHGTSRMDTEVTLAALITLCIKEYYAPQRRL